MCAVVNPPLPQEMSRTLGKTLGTATVRKLASKQPLGLEALLVIINDFNCILARSGVTGRSIPRHQTIPGVEQG